MMLVDGDLESTVQLAQAMFQDVGKADEDGQRDAAQDERVNQLLQVDRARGVLVRMHADVAAVVDGEIALAPTGNVVKIGGTLGGPPFGRLENNRPFSAVSFQ